MSDDLVHRLDMATVASCSCETKTPDIEHHDPMCRYRLFREAADEVGNLERLFDLQWKADQRAIKRFSARRVSELLFDPPSTQATFEARKRGNEFGRYVDGVLRDADEDE